MYLEIFLADFAVCRVFWGISRDFAGMPEFRGSATARNIRGPVQWITQFVAIILIRWMAIYSVESTIQHQNNRGLVRPAILPFSHSSANKVKITVYIIHCISCMTNIKHYWCMCINFVPKCYDLIQEMRRQGRTPLYSLI